MLFLLILNINFLRLMQYSFTTQMPLYSSYLVQNVLWASRNIGLFFSITIADDLQCHRGRTVKIKYMYLQRKSNVTQCYVNVSGKNRREIMKRWSDMDDRNFCPPALMPLSKLLNSGAAAGHGVNFRDLPIHCFGYVKENNLLNGYSFHLL